MKKILMCFPSQFGVNYEINPWMNSNVGKVNFQEAIMQWENLYQKLSEVAKVLVMQNQPKELPDLVFTANAALILNKNALLARFACEERRPESLFYKETLESSGLCVDDYFLREEISFEGAGDALLERNKNILVLGYGFRTVQNAHSYVTSWVKKVSPITEILQVNLVNPNFYHLDTCFCPLDNGYVLYYPKAFSIQSQNDLVSVFADKLIAVDEESANLFGCNAVSIGNKLILNNVSKGFKNYLNKIGIEVIKSPLDQFMLSGGSAKCLTLELSLEV